MRTLEEVVALETAPRVVQLRVLGAFAVAAFLLAAIGIHGLLAFTVSSRSREIGVRIALGAKARDIMWMVIGRSAMLARDRRDARRRARVRGGPLDAGAAVRRRSRPMSASSAAAIALSLLMALAGSILPAWRAIRVDPITATRAD